MNTNYKRPYVFAALEKNLGLETHFLQILIGPRQVGKTTTVEQLLSQSEDPHLYITADTLTPPDTQWLSEHWHKARQLTGKKPLFVVDEVQKIPRWSEAVKKFHDEDRRAGARLRVILLGSSSLLLQKGLSESLAGRFQLIRCPHWSFRECRGAFQWTLDDFLFYGGYPGAQIFKTDFEAWRDYIQNALLETVLGRDIPSMQPVLNPALFRQTLHLACSHPAEIISLQKLLGQLQSKGSIPTLAHYLRLLAGAFLIEPLQKWSEKPIRVKSSSPKLVVRNNALITALKGSPPEVVLNDAELKGRLIENAVGAALVNAAESVFYWNDRDHEVDYVVQRPNELLALEVKSGRQRSSRNLTLFASRFKNVRPVRIGGPDADVSLENFLEKGL